MFYFGNSYRKCHFYFLDSPLSILFDEVVYIEDIRNTYRKIQYLESQYKEKTFSFDECLDDTFSVASKICSIDLKEIHDDNEIIELRNGIKSISNFLFSKKYYLFQAKISASKIALLAFLIKNSQIPINSINSLKFDSKIHNNQDLGLDKEFQRFSKLKSINYECFYYWTIISNLKLKYNL